MQTLFVDTISTVCKDDYLPEQIKVWTSSVHDTQRWIDKLRSQYFLVAQMEGKIVGYASLGDKDYFDFLYVHRDYQRQGVAESLYIKIEEEAVKRGATFLYSDVSITARPFCEKKGFRTLRAQTLLIKNVEIMNYKMIKQLS